MIEIITGICFAFFFKDMHQFHKKWKLNFRPFNCISCLAGWSALVFYLLPDWITNALSVLFIAGALAPLFVELYNKIFYGTE